jgi:hypothetical protein
VTDDKKPDGVGLQLAQAAFLGALMRSRGARPRSPVVVVKRAHAGTREAERRRRQMERNAAKAAKKGS